MECQFSVEKVKGQVTGRQTLKKLPISGVRVYLRPADQAPAAYGPAAN